MLWPNEDPTATSLVAVAAIKVAVQAMHWEILIGCEALRIVPVRIARTASSVGNTVSWEHHGLILAWLGNSRACDSPSTNLLHSLFEMIEDISDRAEGACCNPIIWGRLRKCWPSRCVRWEQWYYYCLLLFLLRLSTDCLWATRIGNEESCIALSTLSRTTRTLGKKCYQAIFNGQDFLEIFKLTGSTATKDPKKFCSPAALPPQWECFHQT